MSKIAQSTPVPRVAVLIYDGLCMFEFGCVAEVFGLPRPELGRDLYRFETVSLDGQPVRTQYRGELTPDKSLLRLRAPHTLIIPGWSTPDDVPPSLVARLVKLHGQGTRLMSICSGVFVLAATGLLDGQVATTHWHYADALAQRYPRIRVDPDVLYVDNHSVLTSAGSAAGLDLCLHLVRKDYGSAIANRVAKRLVIPPVREGGQAQFVQLPVPCDARSSLSPVLETMQRELVQVHRVSALAARVNMSERTFLRRFKEATGTTPGDWLTALRMQHAKGLLEDTDLSVDTVAEQSGLGTSMTLRHHFRQRLGLSPTAYRKQFQASVEL